MAISKIELENFKGINNATSIDIKPITVFYGPNSSGKSSCIHALVSLAQTVKLSKPSVPLVLDDELADIHLGRFRDVAHSGTYSQPITLGFTISGAFVETLGKKEEESNYYIRRQRAPITAKYAFSCSRKTQQIHLEEAALQLGTEELKASRKGATHVYEMKLSGISPVDVFLENAFLFSASPITIKLTSSHWERMYPLQSAQKVIVKELSNVRYLGPFRQAPKRQYPTRGSSPIEVGPLGESTVTLLANEYIRSKSRPSIAKINGWLEAMGLAKKVSVSRLGTSDQFSTDFTLPDNKKLSISDLGYGMSQVLPVLTQCAFASRNCTLLFEQPEIHLHSLVAEKLANVFLDTVSEKSSNIVIETHSDSLIHGLQKAMRERELSNDDIVLYKVERQNKETVITKVAFDEYFDPCVEWRRNTSMT